MTLLKPEDKLKIEKLKLLEEKQSLKRRLPFRYLFKDYKWANEFLRSKNRICLLTAANQIGKSTIQIRKMLTWATSPELWAELWPETINLGLEPNLMWYAYPSKDVATFEFETKWKPLLPPEDDPIYGWRAEYESKKIVSLKFHNFAPLIVFKTYAQDVQYLQSGTVFFLACDEELDAELYDELKMRLNATRGYFSCVFTATKGQEFWREAMEERGTPRERFPHAAKWQVSLYDCQYYMDGTPSKWTDERIAEAIADCSSDEEVQRRIFGKFVLTSGRIFDAFSIKNNVHMYEDGPPKNWLVYMGIDYGSGGLKNHPSAIAAIAVSPEMTRGRVFKAWRGDGIETSATDVVLKYMAMAAEIKGEGYTVVQTCYDYAARDVYTVGTRMGLTLIKAEKSHDIGESAMNSLFKNRMLELDGSEPEVMKLAYELTSLSGTTAKNKRKDDLCDAVRYPVCMIPWNWDAGLPAETMDKLREKITKPKAKTEIDHRREQMLKEERHAQDSIEAEFAEWNSLYE
jgi:hypothetical protein